MIFSGRKTLAALAGAVLVGVMGVSAGVAQADMPKPSYKTERIEFNARERLPDGKWRNTPVRTGFYDSKSGKGWGQDKAEHKHNIKSREALRYLASAPNIVKSGTTYSHAVWTNEVKCKNKMCSITDDREVRGIFVRSVLKELHGETVGGELGLQTAYCLNPDKAPRCPDWVDVGLTKAWSKISHTIPYGARMSAGAPLPENGTIYTATTERLGIGTVVDADSLDAATGSVE